jgi:hypothetical protein
VIIGAPRQPHTSGFRGLTPPGGAAIIEGGGAEVLMRNDITLARIALLAMATLVAACGSPTPEVASTTKAAATSASTAAAGSSLRGVDFASAQYASDLSRRAGGGEISSERTRFADLTGDGVEEAVVVVESGGTMGDLGVGVYQGSASGANLVYFRKLAGRVEVRPPALVVLEGAPGPSDPACCPSQVRESVIEWRNGSFEVTSERTVAGPTGGAPAGTPAAGGDYTY